MLIVRRKWRRTSEAEATRDGDIRGRKKQHGDVQSISKYEQGVGVLVAGVFCLKTRIKKSLGTKYEVLVMLMVQKRIFRGPWSCFCYSPKQIVYCFGQAEPLITST